MITHYFRHSPKIELPVIGKTYSLYGGDQSTGRFYDLIEILTDELQKNFNNPEEFIEYIRRISGKKRYLKNILYGENNSAGSALIKKIHFNLQTYITDIEEHLRLLPFLKKRDWALSASREQYYLYMLEFDLVNRVNKNKFMQCNYKIALLPHCVRDLSRECLSKPDEIDYVCKGCSKICNINNVSKLLIKNGVHPYIWKTAKLKTMFKTLKNNYGDFGVLGIACIPELIRGMRKCGEHNIPVIGIPLDANRCARWMGEFYDNTVNLENLEKLLM